VGESGHQVTTGSKEPARPCADPRFVPSNALGWIALDEAPPVAEPVLANGNPNRLGARAARLVEHAGGESLPNRSRSQDCLFPPETNGNL
jgi:hypothetical protein